MGSGHRANDLAVKGGPGIRPGGGARRAAAGRSLRHERDRPAEDDRVIACDGEQSRGHTRWGDRFARRAIVRSRRSGRSVRVRCGRLPSSDRPGAPGSRDCIRQGDPAEVAAFDEPAGRRDARAALAPTGRRRSSASTRRRLLEPAASANANPPVHLLSRWSSSLVVASGPVPRLSSRSVASPPNFGDLRDSRHPRLEACDRPKRR